MDPVESFLGFSGQNDLNQDLVKKYIQIELEKKEPATICNNIFVIQFFFSTVLGQKIYIPRPKKNKKIPEILPIDVLDFFTRTNS
jgi:hypothetical protein